MSEKVIPSNAPEIETQRAVLAGSGTPGSSLTASDSPSRRAPSPFWLDRLLEAGLLLSMALYYSAGNPHLGSGPFFHLQPLWTLPFLLIFMILCWYRPAIAIALLPLSLPFYLLQKPVLNHYSFSAAEITLWSCLAVVLLQAVLQRRRWPYWLPWSELRARLGPLLWPIILFLGASAFSIVIAYNRTVALRAFREEVFDPLLYLLLALYCLRTRQDLVRLLLALFATGLLIALLGIGQYLELLSQGINLSALPRINTVYGSANSVGLLFDYTLPVGLALILMPRTTSSGFLASWRCRLLVLALCLPLLFVLYLTRSGGAWAACFGAVVFLVACTIADRQLLLICGLGLILLTGLGLLCFHSNISSYLLERHANAQGVGTLTKRIYLWESALHMIMDSPITGYGLDNWLCHYSLNNVCHTTNLYHYWITTDPQTHQPTGLRYEPDLSHPHNIFLQIWVSVGVVGLAAFLAVLALFFWLLFRILASLYRQAEADPWLVWGALSLGGAMVAALIQGMVDSSVLEQDLAFCFWTLILALLLLRVLSKTPWRKRPRAAKLNVI
ncbi:O-antigen ligase family protein [Thermogemmatispora sp.]|uniref:O-antigen ligase family protein n=1 Tax=Thermogemmatispora sp. TaxID=1968838 RepID=UPI001DAA697D|nr:O-antigen ligase family protein [Thermogemmatispora sp.]MBX5449536.1 O-antigen ligase family protein [Thermogemmatispora sp.]